MLDGLKKELGLANPQTDDAKTKRMELESAYRASEVFDENDEYDSEEEDDGKLGKRRSFRKS